MPDKITIMIDASALRHAGCIRKLYWTVVDGYRAKVNNNDIEFGSAFHIFRSYYRRLGMEGIAPGIQEAQKYFRDTPMNVVSSKKYLTLAYLGAVCVAYTQKYPVEGNDFEIVSVDDNLAIEVPFTIPYFVDDKVEVLLSGTIDELCKKRNGIYCVCDAKTTSAYDPDDYFAPYMLSHQFLFYCYVIYQYAHNYPNSIYAEMVKHQTLGYFVDGVFLKGGGDVTFRRSDVHIFSQDLLADFSILLNDKVMRLVEEVHKQPRRVLPEGIITQTCQSYGKLCPFFAACNACDERGAESVLQFTFKKEFYNPQLWGGKYS